MRRDIGRHADRDTARAIDQKIREARRQDDGLQFLLIVVGLEIDRVLVDVGEQAIGKAGQAGLRIAHRRRRIAVHRSEIALPLDQRRPHREVLRHTDHGVINRRVAVGMIFTHDIADRAGRFTEPAIPIVSGLLHPVQNTAMDRLQAVADIGERS